MSEQYYTIPYTTTSNLYWLCHLADHTGRPTLHIVSYIALPNKGQSSYKYPKTKIAKDLSSFFLKKNLNINLPLLILSLLLNPPILEAYHMWINTSISTTSSLLKSCINIIVETLILFSNSFFLFFLKFWRLN